MARYCDVGDAVRNTVKAAAGVLLVVVGTVVAFTASCVLMVWWGTADIVRGLRRR